MAYGARCKNCSFQETDHYGDTVPESDPDFPDLDNCVRNQGNFFPMNPVGGAVDYLYELRDGRVGGGEVVNDEGETIHTTLPLPGEGRIVKFIVKHSKRVRKAVRKVRDPFLIRTFNSVLTYPPSRFA